MTPSRLPSRRVDGLRARATKRAILGSEKI